MTECFRCVHPVEHAHVHVGGVVQETFDATFSGVNYDSPFPLQRTVRGFPIVVTGEGWFWQLVDWDWQSAWCIDEVLPIRRYFDYLKGLR